MRYLILILIVVCTNSLNAQTLDSLAIKQVDSLIKVSRDLTAKMDFEKAFEVNTAAEKLALEKIGKESAAYGSCIFNQGRVNYFKGNNSEAEKWYLESKAIREKVLGKDHPDYASSLNNLAILYLDLGNYEKAEAYYLQSKEIREKTLGREHPDYANSLNNLAILYSDLGNYEKAEAYFLEVKEIREKTLGRDHPDYAGSLGNLANLYTALGNYEKAEAYLLESKDIQEKTLGREHPDYASSLNNLGLLSVNLGNYEKAEPYYLESKEIYEKTLGRGHPYYAGSLSNLGILYFNLGNYLKAEAYYLEAKEIIEKTLGRDHLDYAVILQGMAILYRNLGNYEKAEAYYLEFKEIREKNFGREHPDYAQSLNGLASLYKDLGNYEKAETYYLESLEIWEKTLGREHPECAGSICNLANLYLDLGNYEKAEAYYLQSKEIYEKTLGRKHPNYVSNLNNLANLYLDLGNYEKAEAYYLESKEIREKTLGREHPDYAGSLHNLAALYETQSLYTKGTPLLLEALALNQTRMASSTSFLSERELAQYTATNQSDKRINAYLFNRSNEQAGILPALSYDQSLFTKGFLMQAAVRLQQLTSSSPQAITINNDLKGYHRRIAQQLSLPVAEREGVEELKEKANALEKELSRTLAGYAEELRQVKWQDVQLHLKQTDAAIEFISFKNDFSKATNSIIYAALILKSGDKQPQFIPLFEEKSLDSLLHSKSDRKADYVNALYTLADRGAVAIEAPKKSLYEILWKPLEKELTGIKTIYFSPSGLLHRINLDAIPISETETLADKYQLIELNSTRQLVNPDQVKIINNDATLFGGIQYEQDSTIQNTEPILASRSRGELSFSTVDSTLRGGTWNYLAGTEREVTSIEKIMQSAGVPVSLKKGYAATEESFKRIGSDNAPSPRILHLATHGYFFPDPKVQAKSNGLIGQNESVFKLSDHPMLRSGLIMAGGNASWQGKQTLEGREDGILTAYEISQMNLSNTELVVLSACETGLGDIQGNEGVYGLQRAFKIAGAKYLIMSLWQVPDKQTSLLMTTFYKKWLEDKMTIPDAFHAAQKELREIGLDPYQWAGFVLVE